MKNPMTRRHLFGLIAVGSGMALAACNSASGPAATSDKNGAAPAPGAETSSPKRMLVYRDPQCGCCEAWADIARKAGYDVTVENRSDMAAVKTRYGRSEEHTSELQSLMRISYAVFCFEQ